MKAISTNNKRNSIGIQTQTQTNLPKVSKSIPNPIQQNPEFKQTNNTEKPKKRKIIPKSKNNF